MEQSVIPSAVRTPIGQMTVRALPLKAELSAKVVAESVRRAGIDPKSVDEITAGNVDDIRAGVRCGDATDGYLHAFWTPEPVTSCGISRQVLRSGAYRPSPICSMVFSGWSSRRGVSVTAFMVPRVKSTVRR